MSTISTTKYNGIQLGTSYASPLTISSTGFINAGTNGYNGAAVYAAAAAQSLALYNEGRIVAAGTVQGVHEGVDLGLLISNTGTISAVADGIVLQGTGPVFNSGTILSSGSVAIQGNAGLQVTNAIGGQISGYGVGIKAASATITNYGTVQGTSTVSTAVYLNGGGDNGTVSNYGLLSAAYFGVQFRDSGTLTNRGTIASTGRYGVRFDGATASITNSGTITGNNALRVAGDGTVSNTGHIVGLNAVAILGTASLVNLATIDATYGTGVSLGSGGTVSNAAAGVITATRYAGINVGGGASTITNEGTISGYTGINFTGAGASSQTVIDSGTIIGSGGAAIVFGTGDDLLQLQPGSLLIQGNVDGGGGTNTLEFASAASIGTLNGVGANFVNFTVGTIDAGASWLLTGSNAFGSGFTLTDSGTLTVAGTLTNAGSIAVDPPLIVTGTLINSDTISAPGTYTAVSIASGGVVSNTASGVIIGGNDAITASGTVSVSNLGSITGTTLNGIALVSGTIVNGATDNTAALIAGTTHGVIASGTATVANYATITASGTAGIGVTVASGSVINGSSADTTALISGTAYGVRVASGQISNYGTLSGNVGARFNATGSLTNHADALIAGTAAGFVANGASDTVSNLGTIQATSGNGVVASGNDIVIINGSSGATSGLISGASRGVVLQPNGNSTLFNYGTITGAIGLYDNGALGTISATVVNAGTIIGTGGTAISAGVLGSSNLTLRFVPGNSYIQGTVSGENGGTGVLQFASGATAGTLTGSNADFINFQTANVDAGANWVFAGTNTIDSGVPLVNAGTLRTYDTLTLIGSLTNAGTLINSGTILVAEYEALQLAGGSYLRNEANSVIDRIPAGTTTFPDPTVVGLYGGASTIANLGTITNTYATGIYLQDGGTIVNGAAGTTVSSATIYGLYYGILARNTPVTVTNYGVIASGTCGCGTYDGVHLSAGGSVTNAQFATISGYLAGVFMNATGSVSNAGSILGIAQYGPPGLGAGVELNRGGSVTNVQSGNIEGSAFGVVVYRAAGTVTNLGTIATRGTYGAYGVGLRDGGTVVNGASGSTVSSAMIYGGQAGVLLYGAPGTVTNYGTIEGNAGGVILVSGGTVIDAGVISGGLYNTAIYFGAPDALLVLENGYAITGVITATGTGNVVELLGTAGDAVTVRYNSLTMISVGTIAFAPGAANYATLNIGNTAALPGTIAGFIGSHDTIDLATLSDAGNDARTSFDAAANQLMVTAGTATVTLQLDSEDYTGVVWLAQNDGSGGTMVTPVRSPPSISGTRANQAVPNQTASTPFSTVLVTDTGGPSDTATVTLSAAANGAFSNLSGGSYNAATGVYSITGTAVAVTAALDALVFTPMAQANAYVTTTTFSLSVQGVGGNASDNKTSVTSVQQLLSLASVPLGQLAISVSPDGSSFAAAQGGKTNEAVVSAPTTGASYALPAGFQALFLGGTADATLTDASVGNALLIANQGNDLLIADAANDVLVGGIGNDTLFGGTGTTTLLGGGGGSDILSARSGNAVVIAGTGPTTLFGSTGASTLFGGSGTNIFVGGAGAITVSGGAGAATVFAGTGAMEAFAGTGQFMFVGGISGGSTAIGGVGHATLFGGAGTNNMLFGGAGAATIYGGAGGDVLVAGGSAGDLILAGAGNETLIGSNQASADTLAGGSGNDLMVAGNGNDVMFGGSGPDTMLAGIGNAVMVAGSAQDLFVFANGHAGGSDIIWNFTQGRDHVLLANYGPNAVATALAGAVVAGGSTTITLADNTRITFGGIAQLTAHDFG
jgi:hypothetical protein